MQNESENQKALPHVEEDSAHEKGSQISSHEKCDRELIDCFSECAKNIINGRVQLTKRQYARLQQQKKDLRKLANTHTTLKKRRSILRQKGGFITSLLVPALATLGGILMNKLTS